MYKSKRFDSYGTMKPDEFEDQEYEKI